MYLFLQLYNTIYSQVIFFCNQHIDCYQESYCDKLLECSYCSQITSQFCDSFDDNCCSQDFLTQCPTNPNHCPKNSPPSSNNIHNSMNPYLGIFLITFTSATIIYTSLGCYYNYKKEKPKNELFPHLSFWKQIPGLVKDGIFYSIQTCNNNLKYNRLYNKILP